MERVEGLPAKESLGRRLSRMLRRGQKDSMEQPIKPLSDALLFRGVRDLLG